jgi:hypothetical protein
MDMRQEPFSSDEPGGRAGGRDEDRAQESQGRQLVPVVVEPRVDPRARPGVHSAPLAGGLSATVADIAQRATAFGKRHSAVLAAAIVLILGSAGSFAIAELSGSQPGSGGRASSGTEAASVAAMTQWKSPLVIGTEQRQADIARLSDELRKMKAGLDGLRTSVEATRNGDDLKALRTTVAGLKDELARTKQESASALTKVTGQLDRIGDGSAKLAQIAERLDRIEKQTADQTVTGSIKPAAPVPTARPAPAKVEAKAQPKIVPGWSVREVYDGAALLEGHGGLFEVSPGANVPGLGRVQSIERRSGGWVVVTAAGLVQSQW